MDFRYIIILISSLLFFTLINQLTDQLNPEWAAIATIISYGIASFFIFPFVLDDTNS